MSIFIIYQYLLEPRWFILKSKKLPIFGRFWKPFGGHFGTQNRSGRGSENELDFRVVFKRPQGATGSCGGGSAELRGARAGPPGRGRGGVVILEKIVVLKL